jgi:UDP-N-acetylmuramoyl-tripeptide--D-alanyl-D-alanine ligase
VTVVDALVLAAGVAAIGLALLRWLRVAQREHYLPGSAARFASRWWARTPVDTACFVLSCAGAVASAWFPPAAVLTAAATAAAPVHLKVRGRTSRLSWTRRLTTLGGVAGTIGLLGLAAGSLVGGLKGAVFAAAVLGVLAPIVVDVALGLTRPIEDRLSDKFVRRAVARLQRVKPVIVAVTGSYGKTTTKGYIAHIAGANRDTVASPASYNNKNGLARTVNEHLGPATEVLVAEMGTYGPGEIAEMCEWMMPAIAVITAIGPAHLERFKTLDRTLAAKAEITKYAHVVVLNVDDTRLASLAESLASSTQHIVRVSGSDPNADVAILAVPDGIELRVGGKRQGLAAIGATARPTALSNAACAVAVALELGLPAPAILARLANLPLPPNRLQKYAAEKGYVVLDDTFNSNPAGARLALGRLADEAVSGRRVLVTPGMVELGREQFRENAAFAEAAAAIVSDLAIVARTNRKALTAGVAKAGSGTNLVAFDRLDQAVEWVRGQLGNEDAVLYENDLPDHFP